VKETCIALRSLFNNKLCDSYNFVLIYVIHYAIERHEQLNQRKSLY